MKEPKPVLPFYFGQPGKPLFGCYHEPFRESGRRRAILICQPVGHEYVNSHRALRQLAARLAEAGFPVLRFDYYGCGDSSGDTDEGSISQWLGDIATAIAELKRKTGLPQVCVIGLRLGGTLAAIAGSQRDDFESLVLWDPVVTGKGYLKELFSLHAEMLRFRPKPKRCKKPQPYAEVLGFPFSRLLHTELERLDLLHIAEKLPTRVLVVQNSQTSDEDRLKDHLPKICARGEHQELEAPKTWLPTVDGRLIVPVPVLQSVVSWICEASC